MELDNFSLEHLLLLSVSCLFFSNHHAIFKLPDGAELKSSAFSQGYKVWFYMPQSGCIRGFLPEVKLI